MRGALVVEALEGLDALHELLGQVEVVRLVRGPEARGEDLHAQVGVELDLVRVRVRVRVRARVRVRVRVTWLLG